CGSWRDDAHFIRTRNHHPQTDSGRLLDTPMRRPRALLELQLPPLDLERIALRGERLHLNEQSARLVARPDDRDRRGEQACPQQRHRKLRVNAHAATLCATRMIALRARGLRATSSGEGCTALPTRTSFARACGGMCGRPAYIGSSCECR